MRCTMISLPLLIDRWNDCTTTLANRGNLSLLQVWNELARRDCERLKRPYTYKDNLVNIAIRQWYYSKEADEGYCKSRKYYRSVAEGTPIPCPSIQTLRISKSLPTIAEMMPVLLSLKEFTRETTGINIAVVPALYKTGDHRYCITQDLTGCDDRVYVQVVELCNSLNTTMHTAYTGMTSADSDAPTILAMEHLNNNDIFTSKSYFEDHYSEEFVSSFGSHGKCSLATVLYFEFVAHHQKNVPIPPEIKRYVGMEAKIDDLITGPLAFMRLAAVALGQIEAHHLDQAGQPDIFPQLQAAILQVQTNPDAAKFIRHLSDEGFDCTCRWCTDPNASLIQTSELAKSVQHLSEKAKQAKQDVSKGRTPAGCSFEEMMKQLHQAGPGSIVNECKSSHQVTDLSTLNDILLGNGTLDDGTYNTRKLKQYSLVVDMKTKYSGKCIHSGLSFTRPDAPAFSQHHPVFGKGDDGKEVTKVRLIREDDKPDIIISDMNKGGPENCVSQLVNSVTSVDGFLGVLTPEFAKSVTSFENFHQVFHHLERNPDICAEYGINLLVKSGGCVLVMLEDVPTLERIVNEVESRDDLAITVFDNVVYADGDIDAATLAKVEAARFPTKYYADAADRAIQYATDAATQEDEDSLEVEAEEAPAEQEVEAEAPAVAETVTRRLVDSLGRMTNEDLDLFCKFVNHEQLYSEDESEEDDDDEDSIMVEDSSVNEEQSSNEDSLEIGADDNQEGGFPLEDEVGVEGDNEVSKIEGQPKKKAKTSSSSAKVARGSTTLTIQKKTCMKLHPISNGDAKVLVGSAAVYPGTIDYDIPRNTIEITQDDTQIILGRNKTTFSDEALTSGGASLDILSQNLCSISLIGSDNVQACVKLMSQYDHFVHLNGSPLDIELGTKVLEHGDVLTLLGPIGFAYRVEIFDLWTY